MTDLTSSKLADLGEFGLISRITGGVNTDGSVITGIGDDAAVIAITENMQLLTSTDMLLDGVHFCRSWHDPFRLGRKSLAVSISDIAAMGGIPRWALLSLAIPTDLQLDFIDDFMKGFLAIASEYKITLIGGDTCSSRSGLTVSVTIMGEQYADRIVHRSGAVPEDDIWVTGTLGDAALALKMITAGRSEFLFSRLLDPVPRVFAGLALAESGLVNSMIDISDGVLADFGHIAEQSRVGGHIYVEQLPLSPAFRGEMESHSAIPYKLALSGGEDYELCFTSAPANREKISACMKKCGIAVSRIGIVTGSSDVSAYYSDGSSYIAGPEGFNHFK